MQAEFIRHQNILATNCSDQTTFLQGVTAQMNADHPTDIRILLLHYPTMDLDVDPNLPSAIAAAKFHTVISGHRHYFGIYNDPKVGKETPTIINGCGCHDGLEKDDVDANSPSAKAEIAAEFKAKGSEMLWSDHPHGGFCSHEVGPGRIVTRFRDIDGNIVKIYNVTF